MLEDDHKMQGRQLCRRCESHALEGRDRVILRLIRVNGSGTVGVLSNDGIVTTKALAMFIERCIKRFSALPHGPVGPADVVLLLVNVDMR